MTDSASSSSDSLPRERLVRWVVAAFGGTAALLFAVTLALHLWVDADFIERRVNAALNESTDARYRVDIENVEWGFLGRSVRLGETSLRSITPDSDLESGSKTAARQVLRLTVPEIHVLGISWWAFLWDRHLIVEAIRFDAPRLRRSVGELEQFAERRDESVEKRVDRASEGGSVDLVRAHRFEVSDGTLLLDGETNAPTDSLWGLSFKLDTLSLDPSSWRSEDRSLGSRLQTGSFDGLHYGPTDDSYVLSVGASRLSQVESIVSVKSVQYQPSVSDSVFMDQQTYRANRVRSSVEEIAVRGMNVGRLLSDTAVVADTIRIDGLDLDVYRDNHLPEDPDDPPPSMPQDLVRGFEHPLDVETIQVRQGRIRYSKRPEDVPNPGAILFDSLWASAYHVTNDPREMSPTSPSIVDARTDVAGVGRLTASFRIPLMSPHLSLSYRGRLGSMDATAFNETFVNLSGVRVESGTVDSLWFEATVNRGKATGIVHSTYRDLEIETLDRTTGNRGLKSRLKTLVVNGLGVRSTNVPTEEPFRSGGIDHERNPDDSFFKFLWHALRDGIYSLTGIDRVRR